MGKERIDTGKAPHIFVGACDGDLVMANIRPRRRAMAIA